LHSRWLFSGAPDNTRNGLMIEPPKATKGRRMSKKSRKKSSKASVIRRKSAKSAGRAKTKNATISRGAASKSRKTTARAASHKPASKQLKISDSPTPAKAGAANSPREKAPAVDRALDRALVEGANAPEFRLPRDGGSTVALSDFSGQKLVLFFYPRADTPGCTREAIDFTRLAEDFAASGTAVLGISGDSLKAQEKFRDKHKLSVPLISDEQHEMLEAYGAWGKKSMYGKTFLGILRTTVLIGSDGRVAKVWRNVKVDGHADAVLAAARALNA
jgi:thioredoxin-dependent peroxiredoxin